MIGPSTHIGPYEIVSRIGAGGMGEVWRARDTRIGRDVAVKVLPPDVVSSPDRLRRFEQEARAAGSLSHPNLVTIHDVGTHDGAPYIVMELLEGDTLRDRIGGDGSGPRLPLRKAVEMSVQIASGLAAAHEKGIVHRDLKPENVFVTRDGRVKILDFGLAKLAANSDPPSDESRTQQRDTTPGAVVGTAGYMSPEQVRGQPVDHRTDVFAFGAILYEALTGRRAFRRESSVETMNAILTEDPPEASSSAHHVPPAIDRIVRRCLEKAPEERFQSARDLSFALEAVGGASTASEVGSPAAAAPKSRRIDARTLAGALALLLLLAITALAAYRYGITRSAPAPSATFRQLTFDAGVEIHPSLSPDGETFVFVRGGDIFLQRADGRNAINLTKTPEIGESTPSFSPDGRQIVFRSRDGLFVMGATGESARRISSRGFDPAFSPDGKKIAFSRSEEASDPRSRNSSVSTLVVLDLSTSKESEIYARDAMQPTWSPDGKRIAFWSNDDAGRRDIATISADGQKDSVVRITSDAALDWSPVWSPDGKWLLFSSDRGGTMGLWRVPVDQATGRTRGTPQLIPAPAPWAGRMSISANGRRLVFETVSMSNALFLARLDLKKESLTIDEKPVLAGSLLVRAAAASPDGSAITFTTEKPEDVFVMRSDGTDVRQLTNDEHRDRGATWTPDGQRILFYSSRSGSYQLWTIRPDGSELTQVTALPQKYLANFGLFSPDQKTFVAVSPRGTWFAGSLSRLPVTTVEQLPATPDNQAALYPLSWSPDGTSIAGREWTNRRQCWIYDVKQKTFRRLENVSDAVWIDNERLLTRDVDDVLWLTNQRTGVARELARSWLTFPNSVPGSREHFVFRSSRVESDIWQAELKEE